ncbi:hypothetical protein DB30_02921 [Enhygromyxa salina]|uniref:Phage-related replication protein n=1 Tax=Enhygromyxa salina TaxID=215803 RepID=A0A0C2D330_9BACT|nr:poly-gamma-glutamate hydrolase family protein [Enhygromyxa salina]KIG17646.1 hypothetical protein DB30_02921 [Enhygromyxa salina]
METDDIDPDASQPIALDRRDFFRLLGATAVPLVVQGCVTEDEDDWSDATELRAVNPSVKRSVSVSRSLLEQPILNRQEHISIDDALTQYLSLGDQCRVERSNGNVALYTVGEVRNESSSKRIRMGMAARSRLGTTNTFSAKLYTAVVAEGLSDAQAQAQSEFVERRVDDGVHTGLVVIAPHGGFIEPRTDNQAEFMRSLLAGKGVSSWVCKGYKLGGGAYDQWHITSTDLSRSSFPGLDAIADRGFDYAVSFHGLSQELVIVGGGGPQQLKAAVRDAIANVLAGTGIEVTIAQPGDQYAGDSPDNVVNWLTGWGTGGIQIEQSLRARQEHWQDIATAVAQVFDLLI